MAKDKRDEANAWFDDLDIYLGGGQALDNAAKDIQRSNMAYAAGRDPTLTRVD